MTSRKSTFRSTPAIALSALLLAGAARAESITDLFAGLAADLSAGNAVSFLKRVDRSMPGYTTLESELYALVGAFDVSSSINLTRDEGDQRRRTVALDWVLEITPRSRATGAELRQQNVKCRAELRGKRWVITSLEPIAFFAPP